VWRMSGGVAAGSGSDDKDGNGGWHKHEEKKAVALGKGVRAGAHPTVESTRGAEKRSAWRCSSVSVVVADIQWRPISTEEG
jgi:hypothetical protein